MDVYMLIMIVFLIETHIATSRVLRIVYLGSINSSECPPGQVATSNPYLLSAKFFPRHPNNIPLFCLQHTELPSTSKWQPRLQRSWTSWIVRSARLCIYVCVVIDKIPVNVQATPATQPPAEAEDDSDDAQDDTPEAGAAGGMCFEKIILFVLPRASNSTPQM